MASTRRRWLALWIAAGLSRTMVAPTPAAACDPGRLIIHGRSGGAVQYTGIPWPSGRARGIGVYGAHGGGILYVGIPYPPRS